MRHRPARDRPAPVDAWTLSPDQVFSERIEDVISMLPKMGININ